jgi:hypothetical protein
MEVTRRGLFGLVGGVIAAALSPVSPTRVVWKSVLYSAPCQFLKRLYFSEVFNAEDWTHSEYGMSFEVTDEALLNGSQVIANELDRNTPVAQRLRAIAERLRQA